MIHRKKDYANPPAELMDVKWNQIKALALTEKEAHNVKTECYRDCTIAALVKLYNNKCAICERDRGYELQVDHYRPKKPRDKGEAKYFHKGYYWLCYNWSNLIPLCSKCNNNKSNKFPLSGWNDTNRISSHKNNKRIVNFNANDTDWLNAIEVPLMINPELEKQPERHIMFYPDGSISGRTEEGEETINICCLNSKTLRRERKTINKDFIDRIRSAFDDFTNHNDASELKGELTGIFKQIRSNCHIDKPFSVFHVFIFKYFRQFICDGNFKPDIQDKLFKYFEAFKIKYPL